MRRREFITLIGGAASAWPLAARAQQGERMRHVCVVMVNSENNPDGRVRVSAFRHGLQRLGWIEGRNMRIDYRWGAGDAERARAYAAEFVGLMPDAILCNGSPATAALRQATQTIPVVFVVVTDPVGAGFVASQARPGGNITGFSTFEPEIGGKWLGFLSGRSPEDSVYVLAAFRRGLRESGFVDGHNMTFEFRWARGRYNELPAMAADLVNRQVDVLVGVAAAHNAAKLATTTIPVVFVTGGDPVKAGLVTSFSRPGGNVTGSVILGITEMEPKKLGLLRELVPGIRNIGVVIDSNFSASSQQLNQLREAALKVDQQITIAKAGNDLELDDAFTVLAREQVSALLVAASPYFDTRQDRFISFATKHRLPAMYQFREFAVAGGLISYGPSFADAYRQAGAYTGNILKGAQPGDLPVVQSSRFELVINLKTAKSIGLEIPHTLLARADDVIE